MSEEKSLGRRISADRAERRSARRKVKILWGIGVALLIAAILGGRQVYHWAKAKRAAHFTEAAETLAGAGKTEAAAAKYRAALQLDPMGYRPLQGAARFASKLGRPEAADLWATVLKLPEATIKDQEEYADLLLSSERFKNAEPIIDRLLKNDPDTRTLLMASRYARGTGDLVKAIEFARIAGQRAPTDEGAQFALADGLAVSTDPAQRGEARKILWNLAGKGGAYGEAAIRALASAPELSAEERARLLQRLDANPSPRIRDALIASDLRMQLHPEESDKILDQTVARWNNSGTTELVELARWLNLHGEHQRVLSLYSVDRAFEENQLLLSRLDALAALQRWDEVANLLDHPNLTLDPSVLESFRARTAQEKNATVDAERRWNHAVSLAGNDPNKLIFVAHFAEQSRANAIALKAYDQLAKLPQHAGTAFRATQRLSATTGDASVQRLAAEKIAALAPDDPNAADQLAYLSLLTNSDVDTNFEKAKSLAEKFPNRLSFRVAAALGYLRKHDPGLALAQFKGPTDAPPIEWPKTPPAWRAVYAATLQANEQAAAAAEMAKTIPRDKLSPQERELIEPVK